MKQKTAMMEAFEHLNLWLESGMAGESWLVNYKDKWLEKEKEQIQKSFKSGIVALATEPSIERTKTSEQYYNETYKQD